MHHFPGLTWDEILFERSWVNICMLWGTMPMYDEDTTPEEPTTQEVDNMDDFIKAMGL